ncbi:MAG TPA: zinc-dependent alcohol dehydrogenase [Actinomycetota bacterium]|nr:zinc-dependent alcohol dehydrogenase [Actinomycetota bacterium]
MRAAVVRSFDEPLEIEERPIPEPGPGQIRVRIETSGVCHTDIHAARGEWPVKPTMPLVPGHEGVGLVDALGEGVTRVRIGDRVAIPWLGSADGTCEFCVKGLETYCVNPTYTGYTVDGSYRDYSIADAKYVGVVPEGIDPLDAAPLTCAGVTTYKAVKEARIGPTDLIGIVGIGGLGHLGLQYAKIAGGFTVAIDVSDEKLALAKELGADHIINAATQDVVAEIQALGGADAIVSTAATPEPLLQAFSALRPTGRLVLVGLPRDNVLPLPIFETVLRGIHVIGSLVGTREDLAEVFALHAAGLTRVIVEPRELEQVNACFDDVLAGAVPARLVMDLR